MACSPEIREPDRIRDAVRAALGGGSRRWWIAFSGGVDSSVLLDAAARVVPRERLAAIHVNHRLQRDADGWEDHCRETAARLEVHLEVRRVEVRAGGDGLEAAARRARHAAFRAVVGPEEAVATAHHRDDQAETTLLRLLRGAGPAGGAAMRPSAVVAGLRIVRPLLDAPRVDLVRYARARGLSWAEDPANLDLAADRSYVRAVVLPGLVRRWPDVVATLSRFAGQAAETASMLEQLAAADLAAARGRSPGTLRSEVIASLPPPRAANALREWLMARHGIAPPARRWLRALVVEVAGAAPDRAPASERGGVWVRRYRGELFTGRAAGAPSLPPRLEWDLGEPLELPHGRLVAVRAAGGGLSLERVPPAVEVRFRRGGERCRPAGRRCGKPLKNLFQEYAVPPWDRSLLPLIYIRGELASVPGLFDCEPFASRGTELAWRIAWTPGPGAGDAIDG